MEVVNPNLKRDNVFMRKLFIPKPYTETTKLGRLGEVFYWAGIIFAVVAFLSFVFEEPEMIIAVPVFFFTGRALMYILSGR